MDRKKFTTGMLAQVWRVDRSGKTRQNSTQMKLVQMEYRIDRARKVLEQIEGRAEEAQAEIDRSERRFATLKDSFHALQQDWQDWKKQQDTDK